MTNKRQNILRLKVVDLISLVPVPIKWQSCQIFPGILVHTIAGPRNLGSLVSSIGRCPTVRPSSFSPQLFQGIPCPLSSRCLSSLLLLSLQLEKFPTAKLRRRGGFYLHYTLGEEEIVRRQRRRKIFKFGPPLDPPLDAPLPSPSLSPSSSPFFLKLLPLSPFQANWRADYS